MMIPFLGMGADQLAESQVGDPRTRDSVKFEGEDGTEDENNNLLFNYWEVHRKVICL